MINKKLVLTSVLVLTVSVFTGCSNSEDTSKVSTKEATETTDSKSISKDKSKNSKSESKENLKWPDWAKPVEVDITGDVGRGPSVRKTFELKEAKQNVAQLRYLVENSEDTDEFPYHNVWKEGLGTGLLQLGEYELAYHYLDEVFNLPDDANFGKDEVDGKEVIQTIKDSGAKDTIHGRMLLALAKTGATEEVKEKYKEYDYDYANMEEPNSWGVNSAAWALSIAGDKEEAYRLFESGLEPSTFGDSRPYMASTNALATASFTYANGDYDKTLESTEMLVSKGMNPIAPEYIVGQDLEGKKGEFYKNHWESSYKLVEGYRDLAQKAKNGQIATFTDLKDGVYDSSNTGYMLTPIKVEVTVEGGKVSDIKATQDDPTDDRSAAAIQTLPSRIVEAQTLNVDAVSSATISSESTKLGVAQALLKAKK